MVIVVVAVVAAHLTVSLEANSKPEEDVVQHVEVIFASRLNSAWKKLLRVLRKKSK